MKTEEAPEAAAEHLRESLAGLTATPKTLPTKHLYDSRGSALFERICALPEYYPTRTETRIMRRHAGEMADLIGPDALVVEPGSGSSEKTVLLLDRLERPAGYVPVDICRRALEDAAARLRVRFPGLRVHPLHADFLAEIDVGAAGDGASRRAVYFPGSTIGNFDRPEVVALLRRLGRTAGRGGGLLVGVDLRKPAAVLEAAYDDAQGVTAAFNLNLLVRLREEAGAAVDIDAFSHRARWNASAGRVEMHLVSEVDQQVVLDGMAIRFAAGETIHTENSYKYELTDFRALMREAGFARHRIWTDARNWFSVVYGEQVAA